jgi:uncharacterized protein
MTTLGPLQPVAIDERVLFIDVLRGFALFGVLLSNIVFFACDMVLAPEAAAALPTHAVDRYVKYGVVFLVDGKFLTLFAFVFGVGFAVQMQRALRCGANGALIYLRRIAVLFLIGALHMCLVWFGDILVMYSLMGALLLLVRAWRPGRSMLVVAVLAILFAHMAFDVVHDTPLTTAAPQAAGEADRAQPQASRLRAFQGDYVRVVRQNIADAYGALVGVGILLYLLPQIFGRFLLGLYAGKRGLLVDVRAHAPALRRAAPWLLAVGALGNGVAVAREWATESGGATVPLPWMLASRPVIELGVVCLAAFYASCIALILQRSRGARILSHLAPVGRMALTNYLTHSLFFLWFLTGAGFGAIGHIGATLCLAISLALFAFQIVFSGWWFDRYRFGPGEWLWRSLSYGRTQPMRLSKSARAPAAG